MIIHSRQFFTCLLCVMFGLAMTGAWAAATTQSVAGEANFQPANGKVEKLAPGQRLETGAKLSTGSNSQVILRFDDGQSMSLNSNSTFVITEYRFNAQKPAEGSFIGSLVKGAMRTATGLIGEANKDAVKVSTPVATVGIRGTDFMLHFDDALYMGVLQGAIAATNEAGVEVFEASKEIGGIVATARSRARKAALTEMPAAAQASFRQLQVVPLTGAEASRQPRPNDPSCNDRR